MDKIGRLGNVVTAVNIKCEMLKLSMFFRRNVFIIYAELTSDITSLCLQKRADEIYYFIFDFNECAEIFTTYTKKKVMFCAHG